MHIKVPPNGCDDRCECNDVYLYSLPSVLSLFTSIFLFIVYGLGYMMALGSLLFVIYVCIRSYFLYKQMRDERRDIRDEGRDVRREVRAARDRRSAEARNAEAYQELMDALQTELNNSHNKENLNE